MICSRGCWSSNTFRVYIHLHPVLPCAFLSITCDFNRSLNRDFLDLTHRHPPHLSPLCQDFYGSSRSKCFIQCNMCWFLPYTLLSRCFWDSSWFNNGTRLHSVNPELALVSAAVHCLLAPWPGAHCPPPPISASCVLRNALIHSPFQLPESGLRPCN